jgi:hypothetical protein
LAIIKKIRAIWDGETERGGQLKKERKRGGGGEKAQERKREGTKERKRVRNLIFSNILK